MSQSSSCSSSSDGGEEIEDDDDEDDYGEDEGNCLLVLVVVVVLALGSGEKPRTKDDGDDDWDMTLNRYKPWAKLSCPCGAGPSGRIFGLAALAVFWLVSSASGGEAVIFAHYNIENYLLMNRREGGETVLGPKPEGEKNTLIRIIREIHPDILGVAEMGPPDQFEEFQKRLKEACLEFPFTEYVSGADRDRHLALLSRFRIVERHSENDLFFDLNGQREPVERGFLDVTIEVNPTFRLRVVGAHLKSKLAVPSGEALLRRNEARLLRRHIDGVLSKDPNEKLLVYGDLNDTKDQPAIQEILGPRQGPNRLKEIALADAQGDRWTYYRQLSDTYDRIDYILTDQALWPEIDPSHSYLYRSVDWYSASDHRPMVVAIQTRSQEAEKPRTQEER